MDEYTAFLAGKRPSVAPSGFDVPADALNPHLFTWQREIVLWALQRGKAALFCECGLGKTIMQLTWAEQVSVHTGMPVLILAPLAVAAQTRREGAKFGIPVTVCRSQADVRPGVNVTNYEMLSHFTSASFGGVVCDESAILKNYMGQTKRTLVDTFARTPYRLCCTATPAPNDHMELGNHAEFLGIMPSSEMLSRWFINDTMAMGTYRLKGHAARDFWDWIASWAIGLRSPSDIGYSDDGFVLPSLHLHEMPVAVDVTEDSGDQLFRTPSLNATQLHREMRKTAGARADAVATLVNDSADQWVLWCNTNYEADALTARIPDAVEVRGSDTIERKEQAVLDFLDGTTRVLLSKASMFGHGLNLQCCSHTAFVGVSYSFEQFYQAIRRVYRFGQARPVEAYLFLAETESSVLTTLHDKMAAHTEMMDAMRQANWRAGREDLRLAEYTPTVPMRLPTWLREDHAA